MGEEDVRRFNVLLEEIVGHVRVVAGGHGVLNGKIDDLGVKFDRLEQRLDRIEVEHGARLARIEDRLPNGAASSSKPRRKPAK